MSPFGNGVLRIVIAGLLVSFGCTVDPSSKEPASEVPPEVTAEPQNAGASPIASYEAIEVTDGGTIRGTVRLLGEAPQPAPVPVEKDTEICGLSVASPSVALGPGDTVADVVVYLKGVTKGKPTTPVGRAVEQQIVDCALSPRLQLLPLGTTLELRNGDPIVHEVQAFVDEAKVFEVFLPFKDFRARVELDRYGMVSLRCGAGHPWMGGTLVVQEHPYYSRTDSRGAYSIEDIPVGPYRLAVWHELLGETEVGVVVEAGSVATRDLELEAPK